MIDPKKYHNIIEKFSDKDFKQDCYLKLYEKAPVFNGTEKEFEKYLNKTFYFDLKNNFRKKEKSIKTVDLEEAMTERDITDLNNQIEAKDMLEKIRENTDSRTNTIVHLFFEAGYTAEEILTDYPELGLKNTKEVYNIIQRFKNQELIKSDALKGTLFELIENNYSELMKLAYIAEVIPKTILTNQFLYYYFQSIPETCSTMEKYEMVARSHDLTVQTVRKIINKLNSKI